MLALAHLLYVRLQLVSTPSLTPVLFLIFISCAATPVAIGSATMPSAILDIIL